MMVFHIFAPMYIKLLTFFQNKSTENKKFEKNWAKRQQLCFRKYLNARDKALLFPDAHIGEVVSKISLALGISRFHTPVQTGRRVEQHYAVIRHEPIVCMHLISD